MSLTSEPIPPGKTRPFSSASPLENICPFLTVKYVELGLNKSTRE